LAWVARLYPEARDHDGHVRPSILEAV